MSQFAETTAGPIHFVAEGPDSAPAVLLIHPLGATLELWAEEAARLEGFRVIRFDLRGHGRSAVPDGDYTIDDLGHDAVAVLDAAGAATAHIAGISIGGLVTMWMGIHAASRVDSLLIAQTAAKVGTRERWEERRAMVRDQGLGEVAKMSMGAWFTPEFRQASPEAVDRCQRMIASSPPAGYLGCCAALRDADLRAGLPSITARTTVVAGDRDPSTTLADAQFIAGAIAGARLAVLPCAHMGAIEMPGEYHHFISETCSSQFKEVN